jgi:hypothetical protein
MRLMGLIMLALAATAPAFAQTADDEPKIRAVIADWYVRVGPPEAKAPWALMAPGGIDAGPGYAEIPYRAREQRSAAAYSGPRINNEMAARAMRFAYDIDRLVVNPNLAKVDVWERGYFYASAAQRTYELAVDTMFVLEKQANGDWKILLHEGTSQGIPPNKITSPMPDLRDEYYAKCGPACDPIADAKKAKEW